MFVGFCFFSEGGVRFVVGFEVRDEGRRSVGRLVKEWKLWSRGRRLGIEGCFRGF